MATTAVRITLGSAACCLASSWGQHTQAGPSNRPNPETSSLFRGVPLGVTCEGKGSTAVVQRRERVYSCHALRGTRKAADEKQETVDWDHLEESELETLWDKYGEEVVTNSDVLAQENLDDSDSKQFAVAMAEIADQTKAADVQVLHVAPFVYWTRVMVLVTAFSRPQVNAIGTRIREAALEKFDRKPDNDRDDGTPKSWTVVDFGDVVIHVFLPREREYYALDDYYKEAEVIPLPFANRALE